MWLLLLAFACSGPETTAPPPGPQPLTDMGRPAQTTAWRALDHLAEARFERPALPPRADLPEGGIFPLAAGWVDEDKLHGRLRSFRHSLPFPNEMPRPNYSPMGARLYAGGDEVPFIGGLASVKGAGWWVEKGELVVVGLEKPGEDGKRWELRVPELAAAVAALDPGRAEATEPTAGAPAEDPGVLATVGRVSRRSLYVPAPGSAAFPLTAPTGARLDTAVALLPDPLAGPGKGDGVEARVLFRETGGAETELWSGTVEPGQDFVEVRAELGKVAGKAGELVFVTRPGADPNFDYAVFASPTVVAPPSAPPRHVLVIGVDTLRWDTLGVNGYGRDTSPALDRWAEGAIVFDNARAPAPRTRPSFRTAATGRYPLNAGKDRSLSEVLREQGFRTAGFAANVHLVPRFHFADGFEHWDYENGAKAEDQIARAMAWQEQHQLEDTFVFLHLMDPHTYYNAPLPWGLMFTEGRLSTKVPLLFDRWQIVQLMRQKRLDDGDKALIRARYDGEVAYLSHSLDALFAKLDAWPGRTLTVLHADHGEEFWDHGGFEHNHSLYDELVHVAFMVRPPGGWGGGPHRRLDPVGLIDLVPTVLDLLEVPAGAWPEVDGTSLRALVDAEKAGEAEAVAGVLSDRPLFQGHLMFDKERWAVTWKGQKYILHTASGREELYDLARDPKEAQSRLDEASPEELGQLRAKLEQATGFPVMPGWRFRLFGRAPVVELRFDAPVKAGGVIDPEAERETRANLEWGEHPELLPEDVGRVSLSENRRVVRFTAGPASVNHLWWVGCDGPCPTGVVVGNSGEPVPLTEGALPLGHARMDARPGTVIDVNRSDADVVAGAAGARELEALKGLGYIDGD